MPASFESLARIDRTLAKAGVHPLTPWWRARLEEFYAQPTAKTLVARVGRGGAKSHTSAKVALNELINGDWRVPPGETHCFAFVSRLKEEVGQRKQLIESFLRALHLDFETRGDEIVLKHRNVSIRVFANSVAAASGFRAIGFVCDEFAKWASDDGYASPAKEVLASLRAMTITHPGARSLLISSPWDLTDEHAVAFDRGNTEHQMVCSAAAWDANPGITLEAAEILGRRSEDERTWQREYAAVPGVSENAVFAPDQIERAFWPHLEGAIGRNYIIVDPSDLAGRDSYAVGVCGETRDGGIKFFEVWSSKDAHLSIVLEKIEKLALAYRAREVFGDQREAVTLSSILAKAGLQFTAYKWSEPSKADAIQTLRRLFVETKIELPDHQSLKAELTTLRSKKSPSGRELYLTNGKDHASLLITLAHAVNDGKISCATTPGLTVPTGGQQAAFERARRTGEDLATATGRERDGKPVGPLGDYAEKMGFNRPQSEPEGPTWDSVNRCWKEGHEPSNPRSHVANPLAFVASFRCSLCFQPLGGCRCGR